MGDRSQSINQPNEPVLQPEGQGLRWGICGLGRAGTARLKSIWSTEGQFGQVHAIATRRPEVIERQLIEKPQGHVSPSILNNWEALMTAPIDALFICSENALHGDQVESALNANLHVCVEFPLCTEPHRASVLFDLARSKSCILHVEHIGLLSDAFITIQTQVNRQPSPVHIEVDFTGAYYRWVQSENLAGRAGHLCIGRLQQLQHLLGTLTLESVQYSTHATGYELKITLMGKRGKATLKDTRHISLTRRTQWFLSSPEEPRTPIPLPKQQSSLFLKDLESVHKEICHHQLPYLNSNEVCHVMDIADKINEFCLLNHNES